MLMKLAIPAPIKSVWVLIPEIPMNYDLRSVQSWYLHRSLALPREYSSTMVVIRLSTSLSTDNYNNEPIEVQT
jgi:hypothetical protein